MNVSSTSTTTATNTTQSATPTKAQNESGVSFDEEMKSAQGQEQSQEQIQEQELAQENVALENNKEEQSSEKQDAQLKGLAQNVLVGNVELKSGKFDDKVKTKDLLSLNIQQLLDTQTQLSNRANLFNVEILTTEDLTKSIGQTVSIPVVEMTEEDAQFFVDVVKNNNAGVQNVVQDVQQAMEYGVDEVQKSANVSKTLLNALHNSVKTGQAVRIDFGNDVAVVMRVGRDGSIMANFIPGDKAVEEYLKNNIGFLKQRFEDENIKYSQLSYSQHNGQERREQSRNNKENKHE